jgi:hypothetical protein
MFRGGHQLYGRVSQRLLGKQQQLMFVSIGSKLLKGLHIRLDQI